MSSTMAIPEWRRTAKPGMTLAAARPVVGATQPVGLPDTVSKSLSRILRPQAAYRWLLPQLAAITPQYIEMVLRGALAGNHVQAWELFDLMEDTWPRLMKNANALKNDVVSELSGWRARPFQDEDEPVTDSAKEKARLVNAALLGMRPDPAADENALSGTIYDAMDAWLKGQAVMEVQWEVRKAGKLGQIVAPKSTFWVHPVCYAWSMEGRLGLRLELGQAGARDPYTLSPGVWTTTTSQPRPESVGEFPPDKFLISVRKAKSGTALGGALLRSLTWWWCAANFSADWLLNLAQVFGLPFRWANYDPNAPQGTVDAICTMLENMGSNAWAAFPAGTTLDLKEPGKSGEDSPQGDLLDRADRNCDLLVLGQTLTSDVSQGAGSRSQGEVHERVENKIVVAAANFIADTILNDQLIPAILRQNFGDDEEALDEKPTFRGDEEEEGTLEFKRDVFKGFMADGTLCDVLANQTDLKELTKDVGLPLNEEYVDPYVPVQDAKGATINGGEVKDSEGDVVGGDVIKEILDPQGAPGKPAQTNSQPADGKATPQPPVEASGGNDPGHPFWGNQWGEATAAAEQSSKEAVSRAGHARAEKAHYKAAHARLDAAGEALKNDDFEGFKFHSEAAKIHLEFAAHHKGMVKFDQGVASVEKSYSRGNIDLAERERRIGELHKALGEVKSKAARTEGEPTAAFEDAARQEIVRALATDLNPLAKRLEAILKIEDPQVFGQRVKAFLQEVESLKADMGQDPELAHAIYKVISAGMANGMASTKRA